jgi:hypothetical protein
MTRRYSLAAERYYGALYLLQDDGSSIDIVDVIAGYTGSQLLASDSAGNFYVASGHMVYRYNVQDQQLVLDTAWGTAGALDVLGSIQALDINSEGWLVFAHAAVTQTTDHGSVANATISHWHPDGITCHRAWAITSEGHAAIFDNTGDILWGGRITDLATGSPHTHVHGGRIFLTNHPDVGDPYYPHVEGDCVNFAARHNNGGGSSYYTNITVLYADGTDAIYFGGYSYNWNSSTPAGCRLLKYPYYTHVHQPTDGAVEPTWETEDACYFRYAGRMAIRGGSIFVRGDTLGGFHKVNPVDGTLVDQKTVASTNEGLTAVWDYGDGEVLISRDGTDVQDYGTSNIVIVTPADMTAARSLSLVSLNICGLCPGPVTTDVPTVLGSRHVYVGGVVSSTKNLWKLLDDGSSFSVDGQPSVNVGSGAETVHRLAFSSNGAYIYVACGNKVYKYDYLLNLQVAWGTGGSYDCGAAVADIAVDSAGYVAIAHTSYYSAPNYYSATLLDASGAVVWRIPSYSSVQKNGLCVEFMPDGSVAVGFASTGVGTYGVWTYARADGARITPNPTWTVNGGTSSMAYPTSFRISDDGLYIYMTSYKYMYKFPIAGGAYIWRDQATAAIYCDCYIEDRVACGVGNVNTSYHTRSVVNTSGQYLSGMLIGTGSKYIKQLATHPDWRRYFYAASDSFTDGDGNTANLRLVDSWNPRTVRSSSLVGGDLHAMEVRPTVAPVVTQDLSGTTQAESGTAYSLVVKTTVGVPECDYVGVGDGLCEWRLGGVAVTIGGRVSQIKEVTGENEITWTINFSYTVDEDAGAYTFHAANAGGTSESSSAILVLTPPVCSSSPAMPVVDCGTEIVLTVTVPGGMTGTTYAWTRLQETTWQAVGIDSPSLTLLDPVGTDYGYYRCVATKSGVGSIAFALSPWVWLKPTVTVEPNVGGLTVVSRTLHDVDSALIELTVDGSGSVGRTYEWHHVDLYSVDTVVGTGATLLLSTADFIFANVGHYYCKFSDPVI